MSVRAATFVALGHYPTATLYEAAGGHGAMDRAIKPIAWGMSLAGPAFTVCCKPRDNLAIHRALDEAPAGAVLVIDTMQGHAESYCGGIIAAAAKARGLVGVVLDGHVRDLRELKAQDLPVFCRGSALGGVYKQDPGQLQVPVVCGGAQVAPGDVVVGDDDGVIVIPPAGVASILAAAQKRDDWERTMLDGLAAGRTTLDLLGLKEKSR